MFQIVTLLIYTVGFSSAFRMNIRNAYSRPMSVKIIDKMVNGGADASQIPFKIQQEGDVFVVLHHEPDCDVHGGYYENLLSVHRTFEQAKEFAGTTLASWESGISKSYLDRYKEESYLDRYKEESYISIVKMKFGDTHQEELYNSEKPDQKMQESKEKEED